jgi:predicted DNA-binding protein
MTTTTIKSVMSRFDIPGELNRKIMADAALTGKTKADVIVEILNKHYESASK